MRTRNILILLAVLAVLGVAYVVVSRPEPEATEPTVYVWQIDMDEIQHIAISLPREGESQAFIKLAEGDWRFDDEPMSPINPEKWGAGITLLLSGPAADKVIAEDATQAQLAEYGLDEPSMVVTVILEDGTTLIIKLGDSTLLGDYYIQVPETKVVATVDYSWYDVLAALVTDPPYLTAED